MTMKNKMKNSLSARFKGIIRKINGTVQTVKVPDLKNMIRGIQKSILDSPKEGVETYVLGIHNRYVLCTYYPNWKHCRDPLCLHEEI